MLFFILIAKENNLSFFGNFVDTKLMINISELPTPDLQYIYIYIYTKINVYKASIYIMNIYNLNEIFLTTYGIVLHTYSRCVRKCYLDKLASYTLDRKNFSQKIYRNSSSS